LYGSFSGYTNLNTSFLCYFFSGDRAVLSVHGLQPLKYRGPWVRIPVVSCLSVLKLC